jgi:hypothetical protein
MKRRHLAAFAALLALAASVTSAATSPRTKTIVLKPGFYDDQEMVLTVTTGCVQTAAELINEVKFYPGPNAKGYTVRTPISSFTTSTNTSTTPPTVTVTGTVGFTVNSDFPKTPKPGATSWQGTATFTNFESVGGAAQATTTGNITFSYSDITVVDEFTSYWTSSISYPLGEGGPNCTYTSQTTSTFIGAK